MASILQRLLGMGGQVVKRGSTAASNDIAQEIAEEAPEVIGKGTSRAAQGVAEEIPDAVFKEITPTTGMDDMSWLNRMDPRLKAFAKGGAAGAGAGYIASELFPPDGGDIQPPMSPISSDPAKPVEPMKPQDIQKQVQKEAKKTVQTETPKPDGLDFDALSKKFDEGMANLPKDQMDFRKIMEEGIGRRDQADWESGLLRASENLAAGLSRTKADYGSSEKRAGQAKQYVQDAEGRIGAEQKQQSYNKAMEELQDESKMRDPNSEISKLVSDLAQKTGLIKPGQSISAMSLKNAGVNLGTLLSTIEAAKGRKEAAGMMRDMRLQAKQDQLDERQRKFAQGLRKEATTGVLGKQYASYSNGQRMLGALNQFESNPSGYKDYATLMSGLKSFQQDESVIREAEIRMGSNATSLINKAFNYLDMAANGKQLQPSQRKEIADTMRILTEASKSQYMQSVKPILEQAEMEGIDPGLILSGSLNSMTSQPEQATDNNSRQVVKKQYSASRNQTKLVYSDGTEELVDGKQ